jgi:phage terminase large subunit
MTMSNVEVKVAPHTWDFLIDSKKRINLLCGGAGSGKSTQLAIFLLERFFTYTDYRIIIARKTKPSVRQSVWLLMQDLIAKWGLAVQTNKSDLTIKHGSNMMFFCGLDDVSKLKSIEGVNDYWIEEATETGLNDFTQLNLRARSTNKNGINQGFLSFNPDNEMSYLKELCEKPLDNMAVCLSTYKDNPFLPEVEREQIEGLINLDPAYHKIYALNQWASFKGLIYTDWKPCLKWPKTFDDTRYGLDFGYSNPTALIEINYLDGDVYLRELLFESGLTNSKLIERLPSLVDPTHLIVADSSEPDRIEEIYQENYDIHACRKGPDSVRRGIDIVRSKTIYYHPDSENLRKESNTYKWREDLRGNKIDEPVKLFDHAMDAARYGVAYDEEEILIYSGGEGQLDSAPLALLIGDDEQDDWGPDESWI